MVLCSWCLWALRAFLVRQGFWQNSQLYPGDSTWVASICSKNICFNLRLSSTKWHCQTPSTVLDIFDFMKKDLWTFNIDCQNFYGSLFVGFHCISGWAKLFTVRTNEPWRRHMFRFNMILASSSILGNIIAFRTTIQPILPSNHHRLNLFIQSCKIQHGFINYKMLGLCFLLLCMARAFRVGLTVKHTEQVNPELSTCLDSTWLLTTELLLELKEQSRQCQTPNSSFCMHLKMASSSPD